MACSVKLKTLFEEQAQAVQNCFSECDTFLIYYNTIIEKLSCCHKKMCSYTETSSIIDILHYDGFYNCDTLLA